MGMMRSNLFSDCDPIKRLLEERNDRRLRRFKKEKKRSNCMDNIDEEDFKEDE